MSKKLVLGLALALVLVSGSFLGVQADCGCLPHISVPSCSSCGTPAVVDRDRDRAEATCQGAFNYGPQTPIYMGTTGAY